MRVQGQRDGALVDPEPEPIAKSRDGVVKVMAAEPTAVGKGESITLTGTGLAAHGEAWGILNITSEAAGGKGVIGIETVSQTDSRIVVKMPGDTVLDAGEHAALLTLSYLPEDGSPEDLVVPYTFVVE